MIGMNVPHDAFDKLEDVTDEERAFLRCLYEFPPDIRDARGLGPLLVATERDAQVAGRSAELALERASEDVAAAVAAALSPDAVSRRERNSRLVNLDLAVLHELAELQLAIDEMQLEAHGAVRYGGDYAEMATSDILQNGATTTAAISLLLQHGLVLDAEARWRGLHELTCVAALLADDADRPNIAARYLAHGRRLPDDDPAYAKPWAHEPDFTKDYEWLRASRPNVSSKGKPIRYTQRWVFDNAQLTAADFDAWIQPSHSPIHMSAAAVARGRLLSGSGEPAGYREEDVRQIAWQTACSIYELATSVAELLLEALPPAKLVAWSNELRGRASRMRPGPRLR